MIKIENLRVDLSNFALQDINLEVNSGEYFIILGPTGAGKTVLLEAIAGLHPIRDGEIRVDDREITALSPEKRGIVMVYQDLMLFPYLSVEENIAFGLKFRRLPKQEIKDRVARIVEILDISYLLSRNPLTLSGGEKQKVALARALIIEPAVLLLDEPLSALDQEAKERMQQELKKIHQLLKVTIIHVTHDFEEAVALGQRVAVLNNGRIVQIGTPEEILRQPSSEFVARFALSRNIFPGEAESADAGYASIDIGGIKVFAITDLRGKVHFALRPEDILISKEPLLSTARNSFPGIISSTIDRGATIYVEVSVTPDFNSLKSCDFSKSTNFTSLITRQAFEELKLKEGMRVWITFKASAIHVF